MGNTCNVNFQAFSDIVGFIACFINKYIVPLIFGVAIIIFFWGVAQFILNSGDETKRKEGRAFMIRGIIALFIMLSIWGILLILTTTFGISNFGIPQFKV